MKISEVIEKLNAIKKSEGDIEVFILEQDFKWLAVENIDYDDAVIKDNGESLDCVKGAVIE